MFLHSESCEKELLQPYLFNRQLPCLLFLAHYIRSANTLSSNHVGKLFVTKVAASSFLALPSRERGKLCSAILAYGNCGDFVWHNTLQYYTMIGLQNLLYAIGSIQQQLALLSQSRTFIIHHIKQAIRHSDDTPPPPQHTP